MVPAVANLLLPHPLQDRAGTITDLSMCTEDWLGERYEEAWHTCNFISPSLGRAPNSDEVVDPRYFPTERGDVFWPFNPNAVFHYDGSGKRLRAKGIETWYPMDKQAQIDGMGIFHQVRFVTLALTTRTHTYT